MKSKDRRQLYGEISKIEPQDDGTLKVYGYASSECIDADGEIIKASAIQAAIPDYLKFGAVREMHQPSAAGTAIEMRVEDDGRTWFGAHVVDPIAVKKVETKVYKGFSVGGKITGRDELDKSQITGIKLVEVSLVDRPANPEAVFTMYKAEILEDTTNTAPASPGDAGAAPVEAQAAAPDAVSKAETPAPAPEPITVTGSDAEVLEFAKVLNDGGMTMAEAIDAVKAAIAATAAPAADPAPAEDARKGMWNVQDFASCLSMLANIAASAQWDLESEGDDSKIPSKLREWLAAGIKIFRAMAAEESAELLAGLREEAGESVEMAVAAASRIASLQKRLSDPELPFVELYAMAREHLGEDGIAAIKAGGIGELSKAIIAKAAAAAPALSIEHAQAAHDWLTGMGAKCAKDAAAQPAVTKAAPEDDLVKQLRETNEQLAARVARLEAQPIPSRTAALGNLRTVSKAEDMRGADPTLDGEAMVQKFAVFGSDGKLDAAATAIKIQQLTAGVQR